MSDIELIVFDMDGVLAEIDRGRRLHHLSLFTGRTPASLQALIFDSDFEREAERGAYATGTEYLSALNQRIGAALTRSQWIHARRIAMTPLTETMRAAEQLAEKFRIVTLTNNGPLLKESIHEILPQVASIFGPGFHATFEFGARKPEPEVFERLLAHEQIDPERALFIDDDPGHIAGAKSIGMHAFEFPGESQVRASLNRFGLELFSH